MLFSTCINFKKAALGGCEPRIVERKIVKGDRVSEPRVEKFVEKKNREGGGGGAGSGHGGQFGWMLDVNGGGVQIRSSVEVDLLAHLLVDANREFKLLQNYKKKKNRRGSNRGGSGWG